ncbi:MAG: hydroxyacylglutathione hydrolase [Phycisphaerales bacterium]|nr:MAG: hydroxyacylglutathione hydrolase [Phycisphaerales bacterium]
MEPVITIPALGDNYIYLYCYHQDNAFVVDPGNATALLKALEKHGLNLTDVLATHHHFDHTAGIEELKNKTGCKVCDGNKAEILHIANLNVRVITTPGHTLDSVCYYVQPSERYSGILFTGDTLFIGGCGRPIECDAETMWHSLQKIAALPDDTLIYPGHDYTEENYEFELTIEPNNPAVKLRLDEIKQAQRQGFPTVPSTMLQEKTTNVFLRAHTPEIKSALNMPTATAAEVFAELRRRKNIFG